VILIAIQSCHRLPELKQGQRETWLAEWTQLADIRYFVGRWEPPMRFAPEKFVVPAAAIGLRPGA